MADEAKGALATREETAVAGALDASTARMMELAIGQGEAGVAALERLVALQERQQALHAEQEYNAALVRFQSRCPAIPKLDRGARGPYAKRSRIMALIKPALAAEGLAVTFDSEDHGDATTVLTHVRHIAGHTETSRMRVRKESKESRRTRTGGERMNDSQADGSALEYAQRYGLGQALGITTGDADDDGQSAAPGPVPVTQQVADDIRALAQEVGADEDAFLAWAGVQRYEDIPVTRAAQAFRLLERKRTEGGT